MKWRLHSINIIIIGLISIRVVMASTAIHPTLIPIGGGDVDIYVDFTEEVVRQTEGDIHILLLPVEYPEDDLDTFFALKEIVQAACMKVSFEANTSRVCEATVAPNIQSSTINYSENSGVISDNLTAIIILSPSPDLAMSTLSGTEVERSLMKAYENGVMVAGSSEAGNLLSQTMLIGYADGYSAKNSLQFGAVKVSGDELPRGLEFGNAQSIIDTYTFQEGRLARLLNAVTLPSVPHIGIGVDAYSGLMISDQGELYNSFGSYDIAILDAETYQSANGVQYKGAHNLLSLRNVLVHLLSPGEFSYDLLTRKHSVAPPPENLRRSLALKPTSPKAGLLILSGGFSSLDSKNRNLERFINLTGGENSKILIIATGFSTDRAAKSTAEKIQNILGAPSTVSVVSRSGKTELEIPDDITGILMIGEDASLIPVEKLAPLQVYWSQGIPLYVIDAAAAIAGEYFTALEPVPDNVEEEEALYQETLLLGKTEIQPGLKLVAANIEPRILEGNRWGRLFSLAYNHPESVAFGMSQDTAIFIQADNFVIEGENGIISLDLRNAALAVGENGGFVVANGLIDVFAPDEMLEFQDASMDISYIHAATPPIPSPTASNTPTITPSITPTASLTPLPPTEVIRTRPPTRTPRPTPFIPPPTDPNLTNAIIIVGVFAAISIFIGYWLNRRYL